MGDPGVSIRFTLKPRVSNIAVNISAFLMMFGLCDAMLGNETS